MELKQALNILGLNYNCTIDDVKRAHKDFAKKYHPDKFYDDDSKNKATEYMKLINGAAEVINKFLNQQDGYTLNNDTKSKYYKELEEELTYIRTIDRKDFIFFMYFKNDFEKLIENFRSFLNKYGAEKLDVKYNQYHKNYNELLSSYLHWIVTKTEINHITVYFKGKPNIKELREKMIEHFNRLLEPILDEFKLIEDYEIFKPILLGYREGSSLVLLWGRTNIEIAKKVLRKNCWKAVNSYYKRKKLLEELIEYEGEVTPNIQELYNNILDEEAFYNIYNKLPKKSVLKRVRKMLIRS